MASTYLTKLSSSLLLALMGGEVGASAFLPPMASAAPPMVTVRVAIASCNLLVSRYSREEMRRQGGDARSQLLCGAPPAMRCKNFSNASGKTYNVRSNLTAGDSVHGNHFGGMGGV